MQGESFYEFQLVRCSSIFAHVNTTNVPSIAFESNPIKVFVTHKNDEGQQRENVPQPSHLRSRHLESFFCVCHVKWSSFFLNIPMMEAVNVRYPQSLSHTRVLRNSPIAKREVRSVPPQIHSRLHRCDILFIWFSALRNSHSMPFSKEDLFLPFQRISVMFSLNSTNSLYTSRSTNAFSIHPSCFSSILIYLFKGFH